MREASIPVDLRNPGQVFASLGLLEAADILLGNTEGGFDWSDASDVRFVLQVRGDRNPVDVVLDFLARATATELKPADVWPSAEPDKDEKARPIVLADAEASVTMGHWADGSSRHSFKQFGGKQTAYGIVEAGQAGRPPLLQEFRNIRKEGRSHLSDRPFDVLRPLGASFKFDARSAWKDRDVGYSLDEHKQLIQTSPTVELMAALGLEHARPWVDEADPLEVKYAVWGGPAPPVLARAALGAAGVGLRQRLFRFRRNAGSDGYYKQVTFAQEVGQ